MTDTDKYCRHFNGLINPTCKASMSYELVTVEKKRPCFATGGKNCESYSPYTAEELKAQNDEHTRFIDLLKKGLSSCCEAPIDESQVITSGRYKGHGKRFCSKCKKVLFIV